MARSQVKLTSNFGALAAEKRQAVAQAVENSAERVKQGWKARARVKTGHYRDSVERHAEGDLVQVVEPEMPENYPVFLEYGTSTMPAYPAMTPAVEEERPRFETEIKRALQ